MEDQYKPLIEALLFVSTDPLTPEEIERVVGISKETIEKLIQTLAEEYDKTGRGFQIQKLGKGYSICTRPEYAEYIRELYQPKVQQRLSQASLETLAIIAYKQPITRAEIEEIRGVKVEKALLTLQKRGLIQELGRKNTIGTPILYGTTEKFLQYFGLKDLSELPEPAEFSLLEKKDVVKEAIEEDEELAEDYEAISLHKSSGD
ncbi:SMC-Scp complex subunit ScpB [Anoxybacter fermentans]|uniref:Segregation and condensation protein B n=1 Tax=Anoxybacter fermentans TaxID=1323375 RepID=A0A3Q9HT97_9FIRM|nr:SMC-Scp complex subunit ScpB [Anoxybacter fermentans]AZR74795.1 SMC-Scp complex subunit ScpB [Anoxybacter fermentans]